MMPYREIAITGGGGFIASHFVAQIERTSDLHIRLIDDFSAGAPCSFRQMPRVAVHRCSVLDKAGVARALRGADLVVHMAGIPATRGDAATRRLSIETSVRGTGNVVHGSGEVPLIVFSSSAVYGVSRERDQVETRPVSYADALEYDGGEEGYACGKLRLEEMALRQAERGRRVLIIRPVNVVGPGQKGRHGGVIPTFFEHALRDRPLRLLGSRDEARYFSDVEVFCACLLRLLEVPEAFSPASNVINLGCDRETRIVDLAKMIVAITGSKSPVQSLGPDLPRGRPGRFVLDRLCSLIGPVAWPALETTLRKVYESDFAEGRRACAASRWLESGPVRR